MLQVLTKWQEFAEIYEINLAPLPNQRFSTTIQSATFDFEISTYIGDISRISIKCGSVVLCQNASFQHGITLNAVSPHQSGGFFFEYNGRGEPNYTHLGRELRLYYGIV